MALTTQGKTIDGHRWEVSQLPAMPAVKLLAKLSKMAGPALVAALGPAFAGGGARAQVDLEPAARAFFAGLDGDELERIIAQVFEQATRDGKPVMPGFDATFQGKIGEVLKALWWALQVNYGFDVGALIAAAGAHGQAASPST